MKGYETLKTESNSTVVKKAYRIYLEQTIGICSRCKPNRGCNFKRPQRSWQKYRKNAV